jgi:hypothetical protein
MMHRADSRGAHVPLLPNADPSSGPAVLHAEHWLIDGYYNRRKSQSQLYSSDIFGQQVALTTPSGSTFIFFLRYWLVSTVSADPPLVGLRNADPDGLTARSPLCL